MCLVLTLFIGNTRFWWNVIDCILRDNVEVSLSMLSSTRARLFRQHPLRVVRTCSSSISYSSHRYMHSV